MIGYEFDASKSLQSLDLEQLMPEGGGAPDFDMASEMLSRLGSGEELTKQLEELMEAAPDMLETLMSRLQGSAGNQAVNDALEKMGGAVEGGPAEALKMAMEGGFEAALPHKAQIEQGLGRNLDNIDFITGPAAEAAASMVDAEAFTVGNKIIGKLNMPLEMAAEEAVHALQQGGDKKNTEGAEQGLKMTEPESLFEQEAASLAALVAEGGKAPAIQMQGGQMLARWGFFRKAARWVRNLFGGG